jgi:predicted  nucleic acid-binding Zn-ribbon protein
MKDSIETIRDAMEHLEFVKDELADFYRKWEETKATALENIPAFNRLVYQVDMLVKDHTSAIKSHLKLREEWSDVRELRDIATDLKKYVMMPERMHALGRNVATLTEKILRNKALLPREEKNSDAVTEVDILAHLTQEQQEILYGWLEQNEHSGSTSV